MQYPALLRPKNMRYTKAKLHRSGALRRLPALLSGASLPKKAQFQPMTPSGFSRIVRVTANYNKTAMRYTDPWRLQRQQRFFHRFVRRTDLSDPDSGCSLSCSTRAFTGAEKNRCQRTCQATYHESFAIMLCSDAAALVLSCPVAAVFRSRKHAHPNRVSFE
ncbi:hypothetical protein P389DRAFT_189141 [Cystobasidium minutum MCA 4210]|uniref:uncharacterized protein n=1 Tax=Cystobasidium minutum MCA 4210 TaxID=1397322 RepID=UPI0034CE304A|eukprot:jgi/Rhomi1/189141/estExt_fgenesh1_pg.C_3_t20099